MIYLHTTVQLAGPAKVLEFEEVLGKKFSPYLEKLGAKFVGSWFTLVGPQSEVTDLWCFENAAHYEEVMQKVMMDPEAIPLMATLSSLIVQETTKLMYPLPCSPLK
jgi:hypothetical protein